MIRTKDVPVVKTPPHVLALEQLILHDISASEILTLLIEKIKNGQVEINEIVANRENSVETALVALPYLLNLASDVIKSVLVDYNKSLTEGKRVVGIDDLTFDLLSLLSRCEKFQSHSPLLREQLQDCVSFLIPMNTRVCTDCSLPPTAEELELAALLAAQKQLIVGSQDKKKSSGRTKKDGVGKREKSIRK